MLDFLENRYKRVDLLRRGRAFRRCSIGAGRKTCTTCDWLHTTETVCGTRAAKTVVSEELTFSSRSETANPLMRMTCDSQTNLGCGMRYRYIRLRHTYPQEVVRDTPLGCEGQHQERCAFSNNRHRSLSFRTLFPSSQNVYKLNYING